MDADRYQAEVMDEMRQQWEAEREQDDRDLPPHKRRDYAERIADRADMERDRIREELT